MKKMHSLARSIAKAKLERRPYKITYAVTYKCNARCKICSIWKKYLTLPEKQEEELTLAEISSIFEDFDLSWISLTGGEPFLREDLLEIVRIAEKRNPHLALLSIPTNGSLPDIALKTVVRILEETEIPNIYVTVSLDGDEQLHDQLRGVKGSWKKARKTYGLLNSLEDDRFKVLIEFTVSKYNAGQLKNAVDSFDTDYSQVVLTAAHSSHFYCTHHQHLHEPSSVSQVNEFIELNNHLTPEGIISSVYTRLLGKYLRNVPISLQCVSGRSSFFLDPYGVLYPCISFHKSFGNLKESSLHHLLQGERAAAIVRQIKRGECSGCWTPCEAYQTILETFPKALACAFLK
jgi:MoaA/NifB/PqqE/SkfB family radical SAM enzyme